MPVVYIVIFLVILYALYYLIFSQRKNTQNVGKKKVFTPAIHTSYSWYNPLRYIYYWNVPIVHKKSHVVYHDKKRNKLSLQSLHNKPPISEFKNTVEETKPVDVRHQRTSKIFESRRS